MADEEESWLGRVGKKIFGQGQAGIAAEKLKQRPKKIDDAVSAAMGETPASAPEPEKKSRTRGMDPRGVNAGDL